MLLWKANNFAVLYYSGNVEKEEEAIVHAKKKKRKKSFSDFSRHDTISKDISIRYSNES